MFMTHIVIKANLLMNVILYHVTTLISHPIAPYTKAKCFWLILYDSWDEMLQ